MIEGRVAEVNLFCIWKVKRIGSAPLPRLVVAVGGIVVAAVASAAASGHGFWFVVYGLA